MQFTKNAKGFTLIELLVVITIIGILAVGGTTVYTSQIQKARDTTRMGDVKALQGGLEQVFSDIGVYPDTATVTAATSTCSSAGAANANISCVVSMGFMSALPKDPKFGQAGNNSPLDYTYAVGTVGGVTQQGYEVSTGIENTGNMTSKANNAADQGNDNGRYEVGNLLTLNTGVTGGNTVATGNATTAYGAGDSTNVLIPAAKTSCQPVNQAAGVSLGTVLIRGNCP